MGKKTETKKGLDQLKKDLERDKDKEVKPEEKDKEVKPGEADVFETSASMVVDLIDNGLAGFNLTTLSDPQRLALTMGFAGTFKKYNLTLDRWPELLLISAVGWITLDKYGEYRKAKSAQKKTPEKVEETKEDPGQATTSPPYNFS